MPGSLEQKRLPELSSLERVIKNFGDLAKVEVLTRVQYRSHDFPIYALTLGSTKPSDPCLGMFGGVHGLERIGSEVIIAFLHTLSEVIRWDETWHERLKRTRLVFVPIVNPVGMFLQWRANGNGVDLMRNAPVEADEVPAFLLGGHTISNRLPWYRGQVRSLTDMEPESRAVVEFAKREMLPSKLSLALDVHSGFGSIDRLWFPYAKTRRPPPHIAEITALKTLFDRSYPNHFYRIEPQAKQYTTHGDLWDYLYDLQISSESGRIFLPWTLELGSWLWLKKSPRNVFSALGPFNPLQPHRLQRILRRHLTLFDFLHRILLSPDSWLKLSPDQRRQLTNKAKDTWYGKD